MTINLKVKIFFSCVVIYCSQGRSLPVEQIQKYDLRYQLRTLNQKLVDNFGENYENLYGVRNFRVVLRGLVYRGGANNTYNKHGQRQNMNPLPEIGIQNLCSEGFSKSVYLYSNNYETAPKQLNCKNYEGGQWRFEYEQMTASDSKNTESFLKMVYDLIQSDSGGPIYLHCWNGWHASGLISALLLRQFCDYSSTEALNYWTQNVDGNSNGYDSIKSRIKNFTPFKNFKISKEIQRQICL
jgi:hypothetical protein